MPPTSPSQPSGFLSKHRKRVQWNKHFGGRQRGMILAQARLAQGNVGKTNCVTFRSLIDGEEHKDGSNRVTLRLPADAKMADVQQEVGQRFGWEEAAVLYQLDQHGWEIPITSEDQLNKAFADWDASSGPRTRLKYDTLFKEVECLLVDTEYPNSMLRGASASWGLQPAPSGESKFV